MKTLLRGGTVVNADGARRLDVLLEGEKILQVGRRLSGADETVDVTGCLLFPGFVDGRTHFGPGGTPAPADDFEVAEEKEFPIVRTKRFSVKPMSPEEAILQMNLLDHSFFVFRSSEDDGLSIVYRRKNGGYGLIVTDEEE